MLTFDLRSLDTQAVQVDDRLGADDPVWEAGDPKPDDAVLVSGRLSHAGTSQYYWHGRISGDVTLDCRRCLKEARAHVEDESLVIFAEMGEEELVDPDVYPVDPNARELDLRPAIREEWLLAQPRYVLCRDDCKGLCARCGADLNAGQCSCPPQTDSRWEGLRKANSVS
jgi:uncharacterized protein